MTALITSKKLAGDVLGGLSIFSACVGVIIYYMVSGSNINVISVVISFGILATLGVSSAIFSWVLSRQTFLLIIGVIGNGLVVGFASSLLLAIGISGT